MATTTKLKDNRCEVFYTELYALLAAGLDFSHAFALLIEGESDSKVKGLLQHLYGQVIDGASLGEAMTRSGAFRILDCGVVRIGEQTGRLAESLDFLRDYYCKRTAQRRMVASAVNYPIVVLCMAVVVVTFMLAVIVPMFEQVYARMGGELPALTQGIIALSKSLPRIVLIAGLLIAAAGYALYRNRDKEQVRSAAANLLLRLPIIGGIVRRHHQSHFCRLLCLLVSSGVPLLAGVQMLGQVITFRPYQRSFEDICRGLEYGELFWENLRRFPSLYAPKLVALIRVGEETNRLPEMLRNQGKNLVQEVEHRIRRLGGLLEPTLILLVGILVAVILIAMYMPMFRLGGIMG